MGDVVALGPDIRCVECDTRLVRDPSDGNFYCKQAGCGKGRMTGLGGVRVIRKGNATIFESRKKHD